MGEIALLDLLAAVVMVRQSSTDFSSPNVSGSLTGLAPRCTGPGWTLAFAGLAALGCLGEGGGVLSVCGMACITFCTDSVRFR